MEVFISGVVLEKKILEQSMQEFHTGGISKEILRWFYEKIIIGFCQDFMEKCLEECLKQILKESMKRFYKKKSERTCAAILR